MKPIDVVTYFGSQAGAAKALGMHRQNIYAWLVSGRVPMGRQYQLEMLTGGELQADRPPSPDGESNSPPARLQSSSR